MEELRTIVKDVKQDTLDIARVFKLISQVKIGGKPTIDIYFTDQGIGYINALSTLSPKLFVIEEDKYISLKKDYNDLKKENQTLLLQISKLQKQNAKKKLLWFK